MSSRILILSIYLLFSLAIVKGLKEDTNTKAVNIFQDSVYSTVINSSTKKVEFYNFPELCVNDKLIIYKSELKFYKKENEKEATEMENISSVKYHLTDVLVIEKKTKDSDGKDVYETRFLKNNEEYNTFLKLDFNVNKIFEFNEYYIIDDLFYNKADLNEKEIKENDKICTNFKILREHLLVKCVDEYYLLDKTLKKIEIAEGKDIINQNVADFYNDFLLIHDGKTTDLTYTVYKYGDSKFKKVDDLIFEKAANNRFKFIQDFKNKKNIILFNYLIDTETLKKTKFYEEYELKNFSSISAFNKFLIFSVVTKDNKSETEIFYYDCESKTKYKSDKYSTISYIDYSSSKRTSVPILYILEDKNINKYLNIGEKLEYAVLGDDDEFTRIITSNYYLGIFKKKTTGDADKKTTTKHMNLYTHNKGNSDPIMQEVPDFDIDTDTKEESATSYNDLLIFKHFVMYNGSQLYNGYDTELTKDDKGYNLSMVGKYDKISYSINSQMKELVELRESNKDLKKKKEKAEGDLKTTKDELDDVKSKKDTAEKDLASKKTDYIICLVFSIVLGLLFLGCIGFIFMLKKKTKRDDEENLIEDE